MNELRELFGLITENALTQFELEREGFHVKIGRGPIIDEHAASALAAATERQITASSAHAPAPIVGTFYRAPSPTTESFVRIGSQVEPATVVCIIEAMKLMNEIQAETSGEVVKIYVENGQAVEYGQPLFGVRAP